MSELAIIYSLARSGGTLISKCIGCIAGNIVLSEIHPRCAYFNPLDQARSWFNLITEQDIANLRRTGKFDYVNSIRLIHNRCMEKGMHLVIRDWTHVDFTPGNYPVSPIFRLSQLETFQNDYNICHIALTRHPVDTFLSLARLPDYRGKLDIGRYLYGVRAYAELAASVGFIRFEDFCRHPDTVLEKICQCLRIKYDQEYRHSFYDYRTITGENYYPHQNITLTGEAVGERTCNTIRLPTQRTGYTDILSRIARTSDYKAIIEILGYDH